MKKQMTIVVIGTLRVNTHSSKMRVTESYFLFISFNFCSIGVSSILDATLADDPVAFNLSPPVFHGSSASRSGLLTTVGSSVTLLVATALRSTGFGFSSSDFVTVDLGVNFSSDFLGGGRGGLCSELKCNSNSFVFIIHNQCHTFEVEQMKSLSNITVWFHKKSLI